MQCPAPCNLQPRGFFHSKKVVQIFPKRQPAQAACKGSASAPVLFLSAGEKLLS